MENKERAVDIVTVKEFLDMSREVDGKVELASNIQVVTFEENGFEVVAMKGLYNVGEKVVLIYPDYSLPNTELFLSYTAPEGNPKKSRLGGHNRVKAISFNFYKSNGDKVYSNGILLPINEVQDYLVEQGMWQELLSDWSNISELLDIKKYEKEVLDNDSLGGLPTGVYKTDETNINNIKRKVETMFPIELIGSIKVDGSSNSIFKSSKGEIGVCSRNLQKKMFTETYEGLIEGVKDYDNIQIGDKVQRKDRKLFKSGNLINTVKEITNNGKFDEISFEEDNDKVHPRALGQYGYFDKDKNFYAVEEVEQKFTKVTAMSNNPHVVLSQRILEAIKDYPIPLVVRGEIFGKGLKGSGNSNNPHSKLDNGIFIYGIDDYSTGIAVPLPMKKVEELVVELGLEDLLIPVVYKGVINSYEELMSISENYFKDNLIEGIVWRSYNDTSLSTKCMNLQYDSLK